MKISLNWIKEFTDVDLSKEQLLERINAQLGAVEETVDLSQKYQGIIISKIVDCFPHPDADRLKICLIDDGGKQKDIERNVDGLVQVVCGAENARTGILVAWLPPGSTVPASFEDKQPLVLDARKLRGETSNGMLASGLELDLSDDHKGIVEIDVEAAPGDDFASKYDLNDVIIDIENKMFTHRPDCFGILGIARELSGIQGLQFVSPDWYSAEVEQLKPTGNLPFKVQNHLKELVPRFSAASIANIEIKQSSLKMQSYLSRIGMKSINNVVDITNFMMILTAQPIHAYDYDKLKKIDGSQEVELIVRHAEKGEKITLLNGKTIEPSSSDMMVASNSKLVCLGGAIGGTEADVDENTKNIILEAANWDMYQLRRTSMKHGVFTDAVTRFNKGQSKIQTMPVLLQTVNLLLQSSGELGQITDEHEKLKENQSLEVSVDFINKRLGSNLGADQMAEILKNVEFDVQLNQNILSLKAPFWRTDVDIKEDIVEEIGRLYSYDKLRQTLPKRSINPSINEGNLDINQQLRLALSSAGANELLTYNFVSKKLMEITNQNIDIAYELKNALSPELNYYRTVVLPNLLEKVHANHKLGYSKFGLFELGKVHNKSETTDSLPDERSVVSFVFSADDKADSEYQGAPYFHAKKYLSKIVGSKSEALKFTNLDTADCSSSPWLENLSKLFIGSRSALVMLHNEKLGIIGEYQPSIKRSLKLPKFCSGFELDASLLTLVDSSAGYKPLSKFQYSEIDVTYSVKDTPYDKLVKSIGRELKNTGLDYDLTAVDSYRPEASEMINQTFRIRLASTQRTLSAEDIKQVLERLDRALSEQLFAVRV